MATVRLTHRGIAGLTAGRWLTDYWDDRLSGFGVRVTHSGMKSYVVRYSVNGRRRRQVLGHYPALALADARDKAKGILYAVDRGEDPQAEKQADREAITVGELADEYIERHAKQKKRRWKEDRRMLRVDVLPHWKRRPAKSITRRDVSELLDGIVERGAPIMANRVKALLSKLFNFGIGRDLVEANPCTGVPMPAKARQRDRVLSEEEIRRIWRVLDTQGSAMARSFKLRLITAQRGVEVLSMRWEEIQGDWWTIPADVAKNGRSHRVPLSAPALALLEELRVAADESPWVFPSPKGGDRPIGSVLMACWRHRATLSPADRRGASARLALPFARIQRTAVDSPSTRRGGRSGGIGGRVPCGRGISGRISGPFRSAPVQTLGGSRARMCARRSLWP